MRSNERIKQLANKARYDSRNEKHYLERVHNREITLDEYQEIYDENFAELVVKECIRVPYDMWDRAELNADTAVKIEHRIKEHFGVEE